MSDFPVERDSHQESVVWVTKDNIVTNSGYLCEAALSNMVYYTVYLGVYRTVYHLWFTWLSHKISEVIRSWI